MQFADLPPTEGTIEWERLMIALPLCSHYVDALQMYVKYLRAAYPGVAQLVLSTAGLGDGEYRIWRLMHDDGVERVKLLDPWHLSALPVHRGGGIGDLIRESRPRLVHDYDWSDDSALGQELAAYRSLIAVPLKHPTYPLTWSVMLSRKTGRFTTAGLENSTIRSMLVASLLANLHVSDELAKANAHIQQELERMARIQHSLLPKPIPDIPGLDIAASYATFGKVGGDIYDFVSLGDDAGRWCIFLGDASGHGPSAAVVAAIVQTVLHDHATHATGPGTLLEILNRRLCSKQIESTFLTAVLAFFEPHTKRLTYAVAGHPRPVVFSIDLPPRWLDAAAGLPLGIDDDEKYAEATIDLQCRDSLLLYTDSISEARNPDGVMFSEQGIVNAVESISDAQSSIFQLQRALDHHQAASRPTDDQTIVAIHLRATD